MTSGEAQHINLAVEDVATFIFRANSANRIIQLVPHGLTGGKDLFTFCLDLFFKGMVLLFGNGTSVSISEITMERYKQIEERMALAGIQCKLDLFTLEEAKKSLGLGSGTGGQGSSSTSGKAEDEQDLTPQKILKRSLEFLYQQEDTLPITDYSFIILNDDMIYVISFDLIRR